MTPRPNPASPESPSFGAVEVVCESVSSGYLESEVLRDVSFTVSAPGVYVVLGPNGAGKTTLFRTLAGILRPSRGHVRIRYTDPSAAGARPQLHYLSHLDGMPDGLTVGEALELYCRVERAGPADLERVLDQLAIREFSHEFVARLSAGQRKRVSIARLFLRPRAIYLLDEPTANLDPKVAREIRTLILELARDRIVLYSSHNLFEAREIGQYVVALKGGRVALFDRIENLRGRRLVIGVRLLEPSDHLAGWTREGEYYTRELSGPEAVPALLHDLDVHGVRVRELKEMNNPLEELFA